MWAYQKKLEYPVKIQNPNPAYARIIISQLGGPYTCRLRKNGPQKRTAAVRFR